MKFLVNRFEEKFKQPVAITVRFFDENPFTVRQARYNQGGLVCYCMDGSTEGKQNVKNKWEPIECKKDCQYRMKKRPGRAMCNEEGTLKFMLPEICTDKIWYMKITGHTSIQTLKDYIDFQKQLGNSLIGDYVIFLKEVEHSNIEGKKFKNKVLDIIRKEEFISNNQTMSSNQIISQNQNNQTQLSTNQAEKVEKNTPNLKTTVSNNSIDKNNEVKEQAEVKVEEITPKNETTEKKTTKKTTKTKKEEQKDTETPEDAELNSKFKNYHILIETKTKMLTKDGKPTEYVFATFTNTDDKTVEVIIPPKYAEELKQCDLVHSILFKTLSMEDIKNRIMQLVEYKEDIKKAEDIDEKILNELLFLNYNISLKGTKYLIDTIKYVYYDRDSIDNLEKFVYPKVSQKYNEKLCNIKCRIGKATMLMYYSCEIEKLKNYFNLDIDIKPKIKTVIDTIVRKIS